VKFDAAVIGGGPNGLTAAALLARAGRRVVLCERASALGGVAICEEFHSGYRTCGVLHDASGLRPDVARALELERHGLRWLADERPVCAAQADGPGLVLWRDPERAREEIAAHSRRDAERYADFRALVARVGGFVRGVLERPPPDLDARGLAARLELLKTGLRLRRLGARDMTELLRIAPMSLADWLDEWFECDLLKAALAAPGLEGAWGGPRSAGGVAAWLARECARGRDVAGGPAAVVAALAAAARAAGVELRTQCEVRRIEVHDGRVRALELDSGERLEVGLVAACAGPKHVLLDLLPPTALSPDEARAAQSIRSRGIVAKVDAALCAPLELAARPGERFEHLHVGEDLDHLERAFDAVKYRRCSERPWLDVRVPSLSDPTLAPAGHHVLSILMHCAPCELEGGWDDAKRRALGSRALELLERRAPSLPARVLAARVTTPDQLAVRHRLDGGHLHQAEVALDQALHLRPTADCGRYATPVAGLYLCGGGTHPGGGVTCAPGALAARAMLRMPSP